MLPDVPLFTAGPFDLSSPYTSSGIERSCTNGLSNFPPRSGWSFDVFPAPRGGIGASIGYTWRFQQCYIAMLVVKQTKKHVLLIFLNTLLLSIISCMYDAYCKYHISALLLQLHGFANLILYMIVSYQGLGVYR